MSTADETRLNIQSAEKRLMKIQLAQMIEYEKVVKKCLIVAWQKMTPLWKRKRHNNMMSAKYRIVKGRDI